MQITEVEREFYMRQAIAICRTGIDAGQSPFGAVIVSPDERVIRAHNTVWQTGDITAHAEVACIRAACRELATIDLSGCWMFTTTEPCPMCAAAIHWARIETVVFGASIADAVEAGFNELPVSCAQMLAASRTCVIGDVLAAECRALFASWRAQRSCRPY